MAEIYPVNVYVSLCTMLNLGISVNQRNKVYLAPIGSNLIVRKKYKPKTIQKRNTLLWLHNVTISCNYFFHENILNLALASSPSVAL